MRTSIFRRGAIILAASMVALLAIFTAGVVWPTPQLEPNRTQGPLAIVGITVVDVRSSVLLPDRTVLVDAGHIVAVGARDSVRLPGGAAVIDGAGRYLMPALWDMHTHVYAVSPLLDLPLYRHRRGRGNPDHTRDRQPGQRAAERAGAGVLRDG
jgi:hypothetical protein